MRSLSLILIALSLIVPSIATAQSRPQPKAAPAYVERGTVRVKLVTTMGEIVVALDGRRAPKTVTNFLAYVDDGRLDDTEFYRASRRKSDPAFGFVQGGIAQDARRMLPPLALESTDQTGIRHLDGTISMARGQAIDAANANFSIMVGANPGLDARPGNRGYAAFGRVVSGMPVVKRMLAMPTGGGRDAMKGQMILKPVRIIRAVRMDGTARPTGRVKPWLIGVKR